MDQGSSLYDNGSELPEEERHGPLLLVLSLQRIYSLVRCIIAIAMTLFFGSRTVYHISI